MKYRNFMLIFLMAGISTNVFAKYDLLKVMGPIGLIGCLVGAKMVKSSKDCIRSYQGVLKNPKAYYDWLKECCAQCNIRQNGRFDIYSQLLEAENDDKKLKEIAYYIVKSNEIKCEISKTFGYYVMGASLVGFVFLPLAEDIFPNGF